MMLRIWCMVRGKSEEDIIGEGKGRGGVMYAKWRYEERRKRREMR